MSTQSSPSLYSHHPASNLEHGQGCNHVPSPYALSEKLLPLVAPDTPATAADHEEYRRISILAGPKLRKYAENPWEEESFSNRGSTMTEISTAVNGFGKSATKMMRGMRSATRSRSKSTTRTGREVTDNQYQSRSTDYTLSPSQSNDTEIAPDFQTRKALYNMLAANRPLLSSPSNSSCVSRETEHGKSEYGRSEFSRSSSTLSSRSQQLNTPRPSSTYTTTTRRSSSSSPASESQTMTAQLHKVQPVNMTKTEYPYAIPSLHPGHPVLATSDRPWLQSGSPAFTLISLQDAQEKQRQNRQAIAERCAIKEPQATHERPSTETCAIQTNSPQFRLRGKKSGLLKLFKSSSITPPLPTPSQNMSSAESLPEGSGQRESSFSMTNTKHGGQADGVLCSDEPDTQNITIPRPLLQLRPISMSFAKAFGQLSDLSEADIISDAPGPGSEADSNDVTLLRRQFANARKAWQVQIYELEAQLREARHELASARECRRSVFSELPCRSCGCSCGPSTEGNTPNAKPHTSVIDRARVKTGGARGVFGSGSLYEWE